MKHIHIQGDSSTNEDWLSIIILTIAAIIFVTAELLPIGILVEMSESFHQPIGNVGLIVTGYAWTVAISAVLITSLTANLERRKLLLLITALFSVTNLLVALSPSIWVLLIARILGAFSHGIFWSIVGPLCVRLSGKGSKARATAIVFGGIGIATVISVPLGTWLSQLLGWRLIFVGIAAISLLLAIAIIFHFPKLSSRSHSHLRQLSSLIRIPLLRRLFPMTVLAITGHFCAFTYISPLLEESLGVAHSSLFIYLFLFGSAGVAGSIFAGRFSDHQLRKLCQWSMIIMIMVIFTSAILPKGSTTTVALLVAFWGASISILTVTLQSLILTLPTEIHDVASAVHVSMFNIGIGSGALLGGLLVDYAPLQAVALVASLALLIATVIIAWPARTNITLQKTSNI